MLILFISGVPHSLQGLKGGVEFLLVFDDGSFSEDNTFLASELFATNPVSFLTPNESRVKCLLI